VVGHEIGHVVARHTAQRYSQGVIAGLGAAILGAITKSDVVGNIAQLGAAAYVQGFSRDQELEADQLGVQYLTRAGFHPLAMASFLESMAAESALAQKKAGQEGTDPTASLFSSHPRTADRVVAAAQTAAANATGPIARDQEIYFQKIDGMIYGDSPEQGFLRGRNFSHPKLKLSFEAPPNFALQNTQAAVIGRAKSGNAMFQFDGGKMSSAQRSLSSYIKSDWAPKLDLGNVESFTVNGMEAATARANVRIDNGPAELRLVAIRYSGAQVYRFMFLGAPDIPQSLDEQFRDTVYSFRQLSNSEAAALKPRVIDIVTVKKGDTAQSLAERMAVEDYPLETFLALNGVKSGQALQPGRKVKLVVWGN
jgi:predicted Zn-dependent protease